MKRHNNRTSLKLEVLEDRTLPAVTVWTGANAAHDTNWSDPANWSNGVPGPNDTASFDGGSTGQFDQSTVDRFFSIQGIMRSGAGGGTITVNAPLFLTGESEWDRGTLVINSPGGSVTNNGHISSSGSGQVWISGNGIFVNNGEIFRHDTAFDLYVGVFRTGMGEQTTELYNTVTGTIVFGSNAGLAAFGNSLVVNAGTIEKSAGIGASRVFVNLQNSGTIYAASGTIQLGGPGTTSDPVTDIGTQDRNGTFMTGAGAAIDLAQDHDLPFVENGTFTATGLGTIRLDGGELSVASTGGVFNLSSQVNFAWSAGTIKNLPGDVISFNGTLSVDTINPILAIGLSFNVHGTITVSGHGNLTVTATGTRIPGLSIDSGSTLDFASDAGFLGNVSFSNDGTIEKTGGSGTSIFQPALMDGSGQVVVNSGTLDISVKDPFEDGVPGFVNAGSVFINPGSTLKVDGDYQQTPTASLNVALQGGPLVGQLQVTGKATLDGALNVSTFDFSPLNGHSFLVVTAGSISGTFSELGGLNPYPGLFLNPVYTATGFALQAVVYVPPPPPAQLGQVANGITHSKEQYQQFVTSAYMSYLNRPPSPPEAAVWVTQMQNGLTDEGLEAMLLGSGEYIQNHSGLGADWVKAMYKDLKLHMPSDHEVNGWLTALHNGTSPTQIAYLIATSSERESIVVCQDYMNCLGRVPSQAEVDGWVKAIANGLTIEGFVADLLGSPEYYNSPTRGNGNNVDWISHARKDELAGDPDGAFTSLGPALLSANLAPVANGITHSTEHYQQFVTSAYMSYLNRPPSPPEAAVWVTQMQNGLTDEGLEAMLLGSGEYIQNHSGLGADWVKAIYKDLMLHTPMTPEINGWLTALHNGTSPTQIAYLIATSSERESIVVRQDYKTFLGRTPSQGEVDGWVKAIANGLTIEGFVADLLASEEYYDSLAKSDGAKANWVCHAFLDALNRGPGATELTAVSGQLL
jgi:hypothetical protein